MDPYSHRVLYNPEDISAEIVIGADDYRAFFHFHLAAFLFIQEPDPQESFAVAYGCEHADDGISKTFGLLRQREPEPEPDFFDF